MSKGDADVQTWVDSEKEVVTDNELGKRFRELGTEQVQKKFNKDYALESKGFPIFDNMGDNFSDVDAVSQHAKYKIVISEKFKWKNPETETFYERQNLFHDNRKMLFLCTQNPKDIRNLPYEEKLIYLSESRVIKIYDNTDGAFGEWVKNNVLPCKDAYVAMCGMLEPVVVELWKRYLTSIHCCY